LHFYTNNDPGEKEIKETTVKVISSQLLPIPLKSPIQGKQEENSGLQGSREKQKEEVRVQTHSQVGQVSLEGQCTAGDLQLIFYCTLKLCFCQIHKKGNNGG
jgi:hypothetical protein